HYRKEDEPIDAHIPMGKVTETLLDDISIKFWNIRSSKDISKIKTAINYSNEASKSAVILLNSSLWSD
ncbi:MAG: hypothetical protein KGD66_10890, partial [Candidatus Lokiarchaeota archaeon]|nr:hypothetical protein [Candidatus Lokiarchaeota archaeon]